MEEDPYNQILLSESFRWVPVPENSDDELNFSDPENLKMSEDIFEGNRREGWVFPKLLCDEAKECLSKKNAGGNSDVSEAASIQYFYELGYRNFVHEMEVLYKSTSYKLVDFVAEAPQIYESNFPEIIKNDREKVGVSVTRAADFGRGFNPTALLYKKIKGLIGARNNATSTSKFYRSILHIWCFSSEIMDALNTSYRLLSEDSDLFQSPDLKGTFKVITTVCSDPRLYKNIKPF